MEEKRYTDEMNIFIKILGLFLIITGLSTILIQEFSVEFGNLDYWKNHGVFFLIFITLFPRFTLLFSSVVTGGFLWWLAWIFSPRLLVAYLATVAYWNTNPVLVILSWIIALGGETSEKTVVINRGSPIRFKKTIVMNGEEFQGTDTFEADYKVKDSQN